MANKILRNQQVTNSSKKPKKKKSASSSRTKKKTNSSKFLTFLKSGKFRIISGVFLFLFTLFLLCSFISFFYTYKTDYTIYNPNFFAMSSLGKTPQNGMGILGLYFSFLFIKQWFGIASFGILFIFFLISIYLIPKKKSSTVLKTIALTCVGVIFFSLLLGAISWEDDQFYSLGGEVGYNLSSWLINEAIGVIGFVLLLLFILAVPFIVLGYAKLENLFNRREKTEENNFDNTPEIEEEKEGKKPFFSFLTRKKEKQPKEDLSLSQDENFDLKEDISLVEEEESFKVDIYPESTEVVGKDVLIDDDEENELILPSNEDEDIEEEKEESETENKEPAILEPYDPLAELSQYKFPTIDLLEDYPNTTRTKEEKEAEIRANKQRIQDTLNNYGVQIQSISAIEGPTITLYEIVPAPGVRINKIKNLEDDIALSLAALGIRIIAPMPGKGTIGIEVPNSVPKVVPMKSVVASEKFQSSDKMALPIVIGRTISNEVFMFDLAKMPHVLMAGATGQGKSVGLNAVLVSLLYKKHPAELKFVLVDPKKVELTLFSKIERHYLAKLPDSEEAIITDTKKVVRTLNSLCIEMDNRYELLKAAQCRNIIEYNEKFKSRRLNPEKGHRFLPYIVLVFDEFADCIMTAGREVESPIARLAQLARAIGIHLIIATQRPSVNIITGVIKANFPARIAFRVSSKIDSRTILDSGGAERLIGKGDLLVSTGNDIVRLQCALVDTPEVEKICDFIGEQHGFTSALMLPEVPDEQDEAKQEADDGEIDAMFAEAARVVVNSGHGSTSLLQRKLKLGYNRAGRIMDQLEREGIVGPFEGSKPREVRIKDGMQLDEKLRNMGL